MKLTTPFVFATAAALAFGSAGCGMGKMLSKKSKDNSTVLAQDQDDPFQKGVNRPPSAKTLYSLAQILQAQGKDSQAEPILRRIIAEEPKYMPAYCDLAELQMRQRRIEEAFRTLSQGLKLAPDEPILLNNRGMCQLLLKDYDAALANFVRATSIRPDDARYRSNMALALAMLGRYDESLAVYALVMSVPDAYHNLALLCEARGDAKGAAEYRIGKPAAAKAEAVPAAATQPIVIAEPVKEPAPAIVNAYRPVEEPKAADSVTTPSALESDEEEFSS